MRLIEAVGMVAIGAAATFGVTQFFSGNSEQDTAIVVDETARVTDRLGQGSITSPVASEDVQVTRAATDLDTFAILEQVIGSQENEDAASAEPIVELTPEQEQVIAMFRATARRQNETKADGGDGTLQLNNMAVVGLNVRYYYTVGQPYRSLQTEALLNHQREQVAETVCGSPEIKILMEDYGFDYTYAYLSQDRRLIGQIDVGIETCQSE